MIKTKKFSITKYNPIFRNELGHYQRDEWTAFSDIGLVFNGEVLHYGDYKNTEDLYVEAFFLTMSFFKSHKIKVLHIFKLAEKEDFELYNAELYGTYKAVQKKDIIDDYLLIEKLIRLRLRELVVELEILIDENSKSKILFGFDYYMYLQTITNEDLLLLKSKLQSIGLFVI